MLHTNIKSILKSNLYLLNSEVVLITGAAGRIGTSAAIEVAKNGGKLILTDLSQANLSILESKLLKYTNRDHIKIIVTDICSPNNIDELISHSITNFKSITSAIHCAYPQSKQWGNDFEEIDLNLLSDDLKNQLGISIIFSQKIVKHFLENNGGKLIHISSIQGLGAPKFEHYENTNMTSRIEYSAIKAGIISITKWLAKYYKDKNIRVNCISPGGIYDNQPIDFVKKYRKSCTNIGLLESYEISNLIVFLLSKNSMAINGQNLIVDDGWSL